MECRYILDNTLVLPEYIIEFEYRLAVGSKLKAPKSPMAAFHPDLSPEAAQVTLEGLEPDLRPLARPMLLWLKLRNEASKAATAARPAGTLSGIGSASAYGSDFGSLWSQEAAEADILLASPPIPPARPKLLALSEEQLSLHLGPSRPLTGLRVLNLHNCGLKRIEGIASLRATLKVLVLTFNEIAKIEGVRQIKMFN